MYLSDFYDTVLEDHPASIFVVRFEEETPYGKGYSNGIVYWDAEQECPSIILEEQFYDLVSKVLELANNPKVFTVKIPHFSRRFLR